MTQEQKTTAQLLHLVVPAKAEYLSMVRLVVSAVADQYGFTEEAIADIKVALSEAATNVVRHAYADHNAPIEEHLIEVNCFDAGTQLSVEVRDAGIGMPVPPPPSEGLGLGIMSSLMDAVEIETGNGGTTVLMKKSPVMPRNHFH